jgi:hypothetical protein
MNCLHPKNLEKASIGASGPVAVLTIASGLTLRVSALALLFASWLFETVTARDTADWVIFSAIAASEKLGTDRSVIRRSISTWLRKRFCGTSMIINHGWRNNQNQWD